MHLYLVRHGDAVPEEEDRLRPLSERGREEVARVARTVARFGLGAVVVHHSGKLRAKQTAEILAAELDVHGAPTPMDGLAPNHDPLIAVAFTETMDLPTMLVGHLPHLSRLCSLLVLGQPGPELVAFPPGAMVALSRRLDGGWRIDWVVTPATAR